MKPKYFLFLFFTLTIIHQTSSIATVRFVSKTGSSTPPYTSWQTAADSIQKCINICVDGDTIYVANGVYKENLVINTAISLIGSSMDSTIIDGRGMGDITIAVHNLIGLKNFNIFGKGENTTGTRCIIYYNNLNISNCRLSEAGLGIGSIQADVTAYNLIIKNMRIRGLALYGNGLNNIFNSLINIENEGSNPIQIGFAPFGLYNIFNNIIYSPGNGSFGISIASTRKTIIKNNLISGFSVNIFVDTITDTIYFENNLILYKTNRGLSGDGSIYTENDYAVIKNNVLENNEDYAIRGFPPYINSDYNLFWQNQNNLYGLTYGDSDRVADPMFVKDTIPTANGNYDFYLQKYSPAIDKGDPSILDVDGSRSDMGLFGGPYGQIYTYQDLAPKPPANLTVSMDSGLVHLKWNKNTEADFFRYRVYRDTVPDFIYDTTKIIAVLSDTSFYDDPPQKFISGNYYYKITALDNIYHQSAASEEVHINITGIPEAPPIVVEHYRLLNNYPNPFNPSTSIPYRLKEPGYVKVMVYNILGEMVKVLVNKYQNAGYYEVLFSPDEMEKKRGEEGFPGMHTWYHSNYVSGVYLYRIEVIGEGNIPVFTDMKKMMLVK